MEKRIWMKFWIFEIEKDDNPEVAEWATLVWFVPLNMVIWCSVIHFCSVA